MIDVRQFTREVTEAFVARYPERFNGSEDSVFTEDLARMMAMVAALAIEKYDRERQQYSHTAARRPPCGALPNL